MKLRKFFVFVDTGKKTERIAVTAKNSEEAYRICKNRGQILVVRDVTDMFKISKKKVLNALLAAGFSADECSFIVGALK